MPSFVEIEFYRFIYIVFESPYETGNCFCILTVLTNCVAVVWFVSSLKVRLETR